MEDSYPLSAHSSKKSRPSPNSNILKSPILQRSIQKKSTNVLNRNEYKNILKGQKILIELYYQGRVIVTEYPEYTKYMGGSIYQRLDKKVNIFITNNDTKQHIRGIFDRIKKSCPNCNVVSILWLQQCFIQKQKVPFDDFLIQQAEIQESSLFNFEEKQLHLPQNLVKNIKDDIANDVAESIKFYKKNSLFRLQNKNEEIKQQECLIPQEFDLGPPKKVPKKKNEEVIRRKSSNRNIKPKIQKIKIKKQTQKQNQQSQNVSSKKSSKEQQDQVQQQQRDIIEVKQAKFENIMEKYLIGSSRFDNIEKKQKQIVEVLVKQNVVKIKQNDQSTPIVNGNSEDDIPLLVFQQKTVSIDLTKTEEERNYQYFPKQKIKNMRSQKTGKYNIKYKKNPRSQPRKYIGDLDFLL